MNFEKLALAYIFKHKDINGFTTTHFSTKTAQVVFNALKKYITTYNTFPEVEVLQGMISNKLDAKKAKIINAYIDGLPKVNDTPLEIIMEGLCENKAVKTLDTKIVQLVDLAEQRKIGEAKQLLKELLVSMSDIDTVASEAKDIDFNTDNIKSLECFLSSVESRLQGLVLISAASGAGKSIWAMNQALYSYEHGNDVLYINLELGKNEQMARMLSFITGDKFSEIYTSLSDEDLIKYNKIKEDYFSKPNKFKMINTPIEAEIIKDAIRAEVETGLDLVVIDYLQIVKNDTNGEKWKFLENLVQELHRLSLELGIVILTPIQVNSTDVKEKNGEISVTPRGSKELEFSSSLFFHILQTPEEYTDNIARLFTVKARQSKKNTYLMETDFEHMRFKDTGVVI